MLWSLEDADSSSAPADRVHLLIISYALVDADSSTAPADRVQRIKWFILDAAPSVIYKWNNWFYDLKIHCSKNWSWSDIDLEEF